MIVDPILDHVEDRIKDTMWLHEEIMSLNVRQLAAVNELIQSALTDTRKKFENATIEANDE